MFSTVLQVSLSGLFIWLVIHGLLSSPGVVESWNGLDWKDLKDIQFQLVHLQVSRPNSSMISEKFNVKAEHQTHPSSWQEHSAFVNPTSQLQNNDRITNSYGWKGP